MLLIPTEDQEFFRATTERYLTDRSPVAELRRLRHDASGYDASFWTGGAELGWTSLLVTEANGGGSISGHGLVDLTLVGHEFGRRCAPGPLAGTNVAAYVLSESNAAPDVLHGILTGSTAVAWCDAEGTARYGAVATTAWVEGDSVVINGTKRPVEGGATCDTLIVTAMLDAELVVAVVAANTPGVVATALTSVDQTRRFASIALRDVRVPLSSLITHNGAGGGIADTVAKARDFGVVISNAETVGAMQWAFDMNLEWTFDRYSFGRPLASYQAIKHRIADMKMWLEASHAIADEAALACAEDSDLASELVSAAKSYIGDRSVDLLQECVQMHGGIGVTYEHDLHFSLRRVTLNRALWGTPSDHRARLADIIESRRMSA